MRLPWQKRTSKWSLQGVTKSVPGFVDQNGMAFISASWRSQSRREGIWSQTSPGTCTIFKLCRCTNARLCTRPNILAKLCWGRACADCLNPNLAISITNNRLTWIQRCKCIVAGRQETVLTMLGNTVWNTFKIPDTTFYRIHWHVTALLDLRSAWLVPCFLIP